MEWLSKESLHIVTNDNTETFLGTAPCNNKIEMDYILCYFCLHMNEINIYLG